MADDPLPFDDPFTPIAEDVMPEDGDELPDDPLKTLFRDQQRILSWLDHISEQIDDLIALLSTPSPPVPPPSTGTAVSAAIILEGATMATDLTVDSVGKKLTINWTDDRGDKAAAPAGVVVTYASDNPAAATVAADPADPTAADITVVAEGSGNFTATFGGTALNAAGAPIADPAPEPFTVGAGPAAAASLAVA